MNKQQPYLQKLQLAAAKTGSQNTSFIKLIVSQFLTSKNSVFKLQTPSWKDL